MLTRRQLLQMAIIIPSAITLSKVIKIKAQECSTCLPMLLPSQNVAQPTNIDLIEFAVKEKTFGDFIRGLFTR